MKKNIVSLPASDTFQPDQALKSTLDMVKNLTDVLIIAYDKDGDLFIRSSHMDKKSALWMIKQAELYTLNVK
jgi:hypothetical protein